MHGWAKNRHLASTLHSRSSQSLNLAPVVDDLPTALPISDAELDVIEKYLGFAIDDVLNEEAIDAAASDDLDISRKKTHPVLV